jgi:hypothetical protein
MKESVAQYTRRLAALTEKEAPLQVMKSTPSRIARIVRGVPGARLRREPAPEKWSVAEIVAHLAEGEIAVAYRLRQMLTRSGIALHSYDQEAWIRNADHLVADSKAALALFTCLRGANVALLEGLPKERWSHYGMHEERGKESVDRLVRLVAGHDLNHLRQITEILAARGAAGRKEAGR